MTLGENIKVLRESIYMSILDIQEITGLSKSTIRNIESDTINSTLDMIDTLDKIAHALHVTTDELLFNKLTNKKIIESDNKSTYMRLVLWLRAMKSN